MEVETQHSQYANQIKFRRIITINEAPSPITDMSQCGKYLSVARGDGTIELFSIVDWTVLVKIFGYGGMLIP